MTAPDQLSLFAGRRRRAGGADHRPLAVRYAEWRASAEGAELVHLVTQAAREQAAAGAARISVNLLFEQFRRARQARANNSFRAYVARELLAQYPELQGRIEVRTHKASEAA